jgi:hypothetical protein
MIPPMPHAMPIIQTDFLGVDGTAMMFSVLVDV